MSAAFETYYSLAEIAQRIPKTSAFWRAELKAGKFGSGVVSVGGEFMVPASGVALYLEAHNCRPAVLVALNDARQRQPVPVRFSTDGTSARSAGELRRKLS